MSIFLREERGRKIQKKKILRGGRGVQWVYEVIFRRGKGVGTYLNGLSLGEGRGGGQYLNELILRRDGGVN